MSSLAIMVLVSSACQARPVRSGLPLPRTLGSVMFSAIVISAASPSSSRRSGRYPTPARTKCSVEARRALSERVAAPTVSSPDSARLAPPSASATSSKPDPIRPVRPTISPRLTVRSSPWTCPADRPRTDAAASSCAWLFTLLWVTRWRPSISRVRPASSVSLVGMPVSTICPSRSTVTRSVASMISSS